jgi:adenylate cyclase
VLPFTNMSGDPEQEYFADGIVEDIITALSRIKWFFVIARNSSFSYKGKPIDIKQVGRELGVRYVLEGSVRKAGNRVRITGQLIEAETGHHIWADRFEGNYNNIFELQDQVTAAVAAAIEPRLSLKELDRSNRKPTSDMSAYDCFLRAQPFFLRPFDTEGLIYAEKLLRQAVAIDPQYSTALAYLADCIGRQCVRGIKPYDEGVLEAARISQQAVEADPEDAAALGVAAWANSVFMGRFDVGREYAERALQLHPNSNFVCTTAGFAFLFLGELPIARKVLENGFRLSPLDPRMWLNFVARGMVAFFEKNFEESLSLLTRAIDLFPTSPVAWRFKAAALIHLDRTVEAQDAGRTARSLEHAPTLSELTRRTRYAHQWMTELYLGALQRAGYE